MAKKKESRWTRGWQTRKANAEARQRAVQEHVDTKGVEVAALQEMRRHMIPLDAPLAPVNNIACEQPVSTTPRETAIDAILAAARKKHGRADVDSILTNLTADARREAAMGYDKFQRTVLAHHRDEVVCAAIAEFKAARGMGAGRIWTLAHPIYAHLIAALEEAGYTPHGRLNREMPRG